MQKQIQREKALAEAEGRIRENRDNEDINRRAAILKYQEETKKAIESINTIFSHLGGPRFHTYVGPLWDLLLDMGIKRNAFTSIARLSFIR